MNTYLPILILTIVGQLSFGQKISADNLNKCIAFCDSAKADEIIINYKTKTIAHWKRNDYKNLQIDSASECGSPFFKTASMVKSWTGLLIGALIENRVIEHVDMPVCNYIPEWAAGCEKKITIKHLLTMTAGLKRMGARGVLSQSDMNQYVLGLPTDTLPGIKFQYSNESVQLLGIIIERVTHQKVDVGFEKYIFGPMDMDSTTFSKDAAGNIIVFGGCTTTVGNALKVGQLMLNTGIYNGKIIVSEQWIKESTSPNPAASYYGYLWWIDKNSRFWNFAATGDLGQMTIVFPELDLILIRKQSCDLTTASKNMSWMGPKFLELIISVVNDL